MMWDMIAFLRHTLATLAYRAGKTLARHSAGVRPLQRGARNAYAGADPGAYGAISWTGPPGLAGGRHDWRDSAPLDWDRGVRARERTAPLPDRRFASGEPSGFAPERIFSGPIADALTHTGQIAMLRRMAGAPVRGENYFRAEIVVGRVGAEQALPVREFD